MNDEKLLKEYIRETLLNESVGAIILDMLRDIAIPAAAVLTPVIGGWARQKIADLQDAPGVTMDEEFERQFRWVIEDASRDPRFRELSRLPRNDPRSKALISQIEDQLEANFLEKFGPYAPWEKYKTPMDDLRGKKTPSHSGFWAAQRLHHDRIVANSKKGPFRRKLDRAADTLFGKPERKASHDFYWNPYTKQDKAERKAALLARANEGDK
jgi:hypothetical protein